MARRSKPSGCKKEAQSRQSCQRTSASRDQIKSILIASEDTDSSVMYFKLILNDLKMDKKVTPFSCVFASHKHTNPLGVLDDLLKHADAIEGDFDHSWIVIDRDKQWRGQGTGHKKSDFNSALKKATDNGIEVAYSNDSFELWYLLHFNYECSAMTREELNTKVKILGLVDSKISIKSKAFVEKIYPLLVSNEDVATRNAEGLLKSHSDNSVEPSEANPSTTVHLLVSFLRALSIP